MTTETRRIEMQIADCMVWYLSQHGFTESLYRIDETADENLQAVYVKNLAGTVVRTYIPEYALEESDSPRVSVAPFGMLQARYGRHHMQERYLIDVTTHQRIVGPVATRKMPDEERQAAWRQTVTRNGDRTTKLSQQIQQHFESPERDWCKIEGCVGCECARWMRIEASPIYEVGQVDDKHLVMCVHRHHWMTIREICDCA